MQTHQAPGETSYVAIDTDFGAVAIADEKARGDQREGQEQYTIQLDVSNEDLDNFTILLADGTTYNVAEAIDCLRQFQYIEQRAQEIRDRAARRTQ